jgi:iron(III) transport system ATP-binding protein
MKTVLFPPTSAGSVCAAGGALFPHLNVADNMPGAGRHPPRERQRVEALMEMVSLDRQLATHWPHEISGGQQQRVALARALAQRPSLMLLDEPFSALDTGLRAMTRKATADLLAEAGVASILVTHDQNEALSFATQVAVMRPGASRRWDAL